MQGFKTAESSINIEYKDIPFHEAKTTCSGGKFVIIDSKPEQGIYKAQFYPHVFSDSSLQVDIFVQKNQLPDNIKRIEELVDEITEQEELLKIKKYALINTIKEKDLCIKEILYKPLIKKISTSFAQLPENKYLDLSLPAADDGEEILKYLEKMKELGISPDTQKDRVLMLLKNEKFGYEDSTYPIIIGKLNEIGLLDDPEIFNVIAQHPEKGTTSIYGYAKHVPSKIYPFWNIISSKESYQKLWKTGWEKAFEKNIQHSHPSDNEVDLELRTFAYSLTK